MRRAAVAFWLWRISWLLGGGGLLLDGQPAQAAFEWMGGGAQAFALAGAFVAARGSAEGIWFNPASSSQTRRFQVSSTHARLYPGLDEGLSLSALSAVLPLGRGAFQAGLSSLGFDEWREQVAVLGYGRQLHPRLGIGGSLRSQGWEASGLSRRTWSWDLGGVYEAGWIHPQVYLRLGVVGRNLNAANVAAGGQAAGRTPRLLVLAASLDWGTQTLLIDCERRGGRTQVRVGGESRAASLAGMVFRMGGSALVDEWEGRELDVGLGHTWRGWHFDYAYSYSLRLTGLGGIHWFSVGYQRWERCATRHLTRNTVRMAYETREK